jgi:predicted nucleic acid-binding protein
MSNSTQLSEFVVDTIALVLYLEKRRMGTNASRVFAGAEAGSNGIIVPAMALAEILYIIQNSAFVNTLW